MGQTWLGADGATITLEKGILIASRGMGDDLMGSSSSMPHGQKLIEKQELQPGSCSYYWKQQNSNRVLRDIEKISSRELIEIWDINFRVTRFEENCFNDSLKIKNTYLSILRTWFESHCSITTKHLVLF